MLEAVYMKKRDKRGGSRPKQEQRLAAAHTNNATTLA